MWHLDNVLRSCMQSLKQSQANANLQARIIFTSIRSMCRVRCAGRLKGAVGDRFTFHSILFFEILEYGQFVSVQFQRLPTGGKGKENEKTCNTNSEEESIMNVNLPSSVKLGISQNKIMSR